MVTLLWVISLVLMFTGYTEISVGTMILGVLVLILRVIIDDEDLLPKTNFAIFSLILDISQIFLLHLFLSNIP